MQIMPGTGKQIARQHGIKDYSTAKLTGDPALNVAMGEAYLGGLVERFGGSYILAFAGYNAGRGNAQKWIEKSGDPQSPNVDPIDWVESIPFTETRNYVQKVLQNVHVYRTRLETKKYAITQDLNRGGSKAASSGCGDAPTTIASLLNQC